MLFRQQKVSRAVKCYLSSASWQSKDGVVFIKRPHLVAWPEPAEPLANVQSASPSLRELRAGVVSNLPDRRQVSVTGCRCCHFSNSFTHSFSHLFRVLLRPLALSEEMTDPLSSCRKKRSWIAPCLYATSRVLKFNQTLNGSGEWKANSVCVGLTWKCHCRATARTSKMSNTLPVHAAGRAHVAPVCVCGCTGQLLELHTLVPGMANALHLFIHFLSVTIWRWCTQFQRSWRPFKRLSIPGKGWLML